MEWVYWLYYVGLVLILLTGLVLNLLTLPGNWLMLIADLAYAWLTGWQHFHWGWLVAGLVIAVIAEVIEFAAAGAGAKSLGGTIWGTVGAIIGGIVGAFLLTGLVPVPILGTLAGIILGTFLGAMAAELITGKEVSKSALIGYGAAKGRLYGTLLKFGAGCIILFMSLIAALPVGGAPANPPVSGGGTPSTAPTTLPATVPAADSAADPAVPSNGPATAPATNAVVP